MSKRARDELVSGIALRYAKAGRKEKGTILDEAVEDTGYNRKYLIHKLNMKAFSAVRTDIGGRKHKVAYRRRQPGPEGHRGRPRKYDEALRASLVSIWYMFDMMCSKRLMKLIRDNITSIAAYPPFRITPGMGKKLQEMSPATADRLFRAEREKIRLRGKGGMNYSYIRDTIGDFTEAEDADDGKMRYKADDSLFSLDSLLRRQGNGKAD